MKLPHCLIRRQFQFVECNVFLEKMMQPIEENYNHLYQKYLQFEIFLNEGLNQLSQAELTEFTREFFRNLRALLNGSCAGLDLTDLESTPREDSHSRIVLLTSAIVCAKDHVTDVLEFPLKQCLFVHLYFLSRIFQYDSPREAVPQDLHEKLESAYRLIQDSPLLKVLYDQITKLWEDEPGR